MKNYKMRLKKMMVVAEHCLIFVLCLISVASAENYIGIILDGYQKDCLVQNNGEYFDCKESRQLYAGDKIIKKQNVNSLKIKWAPYAKGKQLDNTSMMVLFDPPKDKKNILRDVKEFLGLVKTGHSISIGATRNGAGEVVFQPDNNATLISGQKSTFAWEKESGKYIIFKDSNGLEIFRKDLKGEPFIKISPEEIGMKQGEVYFWNISGTRNNRQFKIRLLSPEVAQQVNADLRNIEKENMGTVNEIIQKAGYLQFISDAYPQDIDLYWFSYLILMGNKDEKILKDEDRILIKDLKKNYLTHVRENI